jgi:signal transduction histidine kinase/ligand-binding sensor domain-containing protein/DNA-binding response OmpR family regulator
LNKRKAGEKTRIYSGFLRRFFLLIKIVLAGSSCLFSNSLSASVPSPHIDRLGQKEGLSNSEVRCIFQDRQGFLWFGTYDGLNRYDGYDFKVYRNQPEDSSSIIHGYVNCIAQDSRNNLWVGTRQGVSILDPVTDKFSAVYAVIPGGRKITINSYIRDIKVDGNGDMLVASEGDGLIIFNKGNRVGHPVLLDTYTQFKWNYSVNALLVLPGNRIYVLISELGLCEYDVAGKKFHVLSSMVRGATCIYPDNGNLWLGTTIGLYHFNIRSATYDRFLNESNGGLKSNRITSLQAMPDSSLWVGTDGGGIQILNKNRTQISYLSEGYNEQGLSSNAVYSLLLDRNGRKWIGTLRGGINMIDEVKGRFQNIRHDPLNTNSLISNFVKSLLEDREGKLWIGTDGGGLSIWDRRSGHFSNFRHDPQNSGSLSSDFVTSMIQDSTGKIWIATYGGGINLYLPRQNRFKVYHGLDARGKESRITFWCLYVDHEGNLWASGLQDGLFLYDRKADQFKPFHAKLPNILSMCEDGAGNLWAGNFEGLYKINIKQGSYRFYTIGKPVRSIYSSVGGDLWLGTEAGLMYFGTLTGKVTKQFTTMAGLSNNNVLAIEEDHAKQLWMSTYNGLCRFDPKQTTFTNFFQSDGLASKEFNFNASLRLRNGQLAFGGTGGLTLFSPEQLVPLRNVPGIAFTDIRIDAKPLDFYHGFFKANEDNKLVSLRIPYKNASLSFRFAAIEFTAQERIKYRYILQGWDRKWVDAGHQRNILYTRLAPGSYVLRINYTNPEGQWTKNELTLNIVVLPPWYATVWAFIAYALIVVGIIYWYVRNKFRETKLKYEIKLANADAEYQRNLQAKEKELSERRIEFFTGVAHEFRTPLSLIINPVKDLLSKSGPADRSDLNIVFRNSRRLLSLVDQLLLFRKSDAVADDLHIAPMDIVLVCREVYLCFVHQAKVSGISLRLDASDSPVIIYGDREKIEIILFNLISNAIKYSANGGSVIVQLDETPNEVIINVKDNGPGIPEESRAHIFEKFYRSAKQGQKAGFGIGLYLARQFTARHQGNLSFESLAGIGTTFKLELLKGAAHFPGAAVFESVEVVSPLLDELSDEVTASEVLTDAGNISFETKALVTDKKTILVIDDDTDLRRYIRSLLVATYLVYEAENGQVGLALARDKQPDLIICDLMMPELNGIEVCTAIKNDAELSYIPMILLTASASPESRIKGLESGADDYIQKPFEKEVLLARIANLLQNRDNLQQYFYNTITLKKGNITISDEYRQFLEKCIDIVERNITDENFSIKVLAAEIGMSHSNLYRKVKSLSGHTINGFIRYIRLRKAAELLIQSDMNVNEVAYETGFNSIKYFRAQFFKLFGANPSDFLKQKRPVFKKRFNVSN